MNSKQEANHREWLAARYLEAVELDDFDAQESLWQQAAKDPELTALFQQVHGDLVSEQNQQAGE
jgi:hypothetical protein